MKLKLVNGGAKGSEIELSAAAFGREFNEPLVHQVLVAYTAAGRAGTKAQLTKAEVRAHATRLGLRRRLGEQPGSGIGRLGREIALDHVCLDTRSRTRGARVFRLGVAAKSVENQIGAGARDGNRDRAPDTLRASRDERAMILQREHAARIVAVGLVRRSVGLF